MSTLLDDRAHVNGLVPPGRLGNSLISTRLYDMISKLLALIYKRTHVTSIGGHNRKVILMDDLFHLLNALEVPEHISDGDDIAILDELLSDFLGSFDGTGAHGLTTVQLI